MTNRVEQGNDSVSPEAEPRPRSTVLLLVLAVCAMLLFAGFAALGTWQLQRLQWKRALIERVEQRIHAAPVAIPRPEQWPSISATTDEYRRVQLTGTFLHEYSTRVQASTRFGSGYWLMTPLRTSDGATVLVNRGFLPLQGPNQSESFSARETPPAAGDAKRAEATVTGLLRISEPGGGFLRRNDPINNRWYSRDVQAIAVAHGLANIAPFFVDAEASDETPRSIAAARSSGEPIAGLTVLSFKNNHLVYALTWYALALMVAGAFIWIVVYERRLRRHRARFLSR